MPHPLQSREPTTKRTVGSEAGSDHWNSGQAGPKSVLQPGQNLSRSRSPGSFPRTNASNWQKHVGQVTLSVAGISKTGPSASNATCVCIAVSLKRHQSRSRALTLKEEEKFRPNVLISSEGLTLCGPDVIEHPMLQELKSLLRSANYDAALALVANSDRNAALRATHADLPRLQLACMISDVLDYGGMYKESYESILEYGKEAEGRFANVKSDGLGTDHGYEKQSCWALLMLGMCYYRGLRDNAPDYPAAKKLFQLAINVLQSIADAGRVECFGSLARAWYCVGLVERQDHEYSAAKSAFRRSIEFAGRALDKTRKGPPLSSDFNIARCSGLGIGWVAYVGARLNEAAVSLCLARRLIVSSHAKFISAYIDVVHASVMVSEATGADKLREAAQLLEKALLIFLPDKGPRHRSYALRAQNELARAHLYLAKHVPVSKRGPWLEKAQRDVDQVKAQAKSDNRELRVYWAARITEARILRERRKYEKAHTITKEVRDNAKERFTRIDACIAFGEAVMGLTPPKIPEAISAFEEALRKGGNSRKISAVCHLHLCQAYLVDNKFSQAQDQFRLWKEAEPGIENAFIADFAKKLQERLHRAFPVFRLSDEDILARRSADVHLNNLRKWLAETASGLRPDDLKRAAGLLGKTVDTLNNWLKLKV
jgi:tetratricopeptide (TPR) repeat protein